MKKIEFNKLIRKTKNKKDYKRIINKYIIRELYFTDSQLNRLINLKNSCN